MEEYTIREQLDKNSRYLTIINPQDVRDEKYIRIWNKKALITKSLVFFMKQ